MYSFADMQNNRGTKPQFITSTHVFLFVVVYLYSGIAESKGVFPHYYIPYCFFFFNSQVLVLFLVFTSVCCSYLLLTFFLFVYLPVSLIQCCWTAWDSSMSSARDDLKVKSQGCTVRCKASSVCACVCVLFRECAAERVMDLPAVHLCDCKQGKNT